MKSGEKEHIIEFKYITGAYMIEEIKQLFLEYAQSLEIDLAFQNFEREFKTLPGQYGLPDGALVLALVDGKRAGCIALRKISDSICEMKRLYVLDEYRGLGIGKKLILLIIEEARKLNYSYMRLDTLPTMKKHKKCIYRLDFMILNSMYIIQLKGQDSWNCV
ncbi:GNAT family N-acetyltransferase [Anoxybacterium hadale]|uniref:GNAT family N-acetyltransferase n=1 Tax=Anoxybacterium hadale TaxID=3408580 RepID=UPI003B00BC13